MDNTSTGDVPRAVQVPRALTQPRPAASQGKTSMALVNFWIDAALFVTIIVVMWIAVMLQYVFPAPTRAAGWTLWGLSYNDWQRAEFVGLCLFALLAVEHLVLHWNWVCGIIATKILRSKSRPDEGIQAVYGVGTFIIILLLVMSSLIAALLCVQPAS